MFLLWLFIWVGFLGALAYHRVPLAYSIASIIAGLLITSWFGPMPLGFAMLFLFITGAAAVFLLYAPLRKQYLTGPLFKFGKSQAPKISQTERIAIEAGTTWWDADLFTGNPNWNKWRKVRITPLTDEEQAFLSGPVETLASMVSEWETYQLTDLPQEVWDYLKKERFWGLIIPKKYGGLEFSARAHSEVVKKLASASSPLVITVMVPNSLGPAELLLAYGTEEQKQQYLPKLAIGEEIPCFALTNPYAGSDATALPDTGVVCHGEFNGRKTLGIRLNWEKRYITLAPIATVIGLAFRLFDPEGLLQTTLSESDSDSDIDATAGEYESDLGITCALIPRDLPGIKIGERHNPLNVPFQNGPTEGKNVFIPIEFIIGGAKMAGKGWMMLVESLSVGRGISLPSSSAGALSAMSAATGAYARIRTQFNHPIGVFEGVMEKLSNIGGKCYLVDSLRATAASAVDLGERPAIVGAMAKYHSTELSRAGITDAMDIHAGKAIIYGPNNYLFAAYQTAPIPITVEGANILTRSMIIFGQGALRAHPYLLKLLQTLETTDYKKGLAQFDKTAFNILGSTLSNTVRAFFSGITRGVFIQVPAHGKMQTFYKQVTWASSAFAALADLCIALVGHKLKFKESLSGRLGDCLSMLFLASCAIKRFEEDGEPKESFHFLQWSVQYCLHYFWDTVRHIIDNFPITWMRFGIRVILMPLGNPIAAPSDHLNHKIAKTLMNPSAARDNLLTGSYLAPSKKNLIGQLQIVLEKIIDAEPIERRITNAIRDKVITAITVPEQIQEALMLTLIDEEEAQRLYEVHELRTQVIQVDAFSPQDLSNMDRLKDFFFNVAK